MSQKRDYLTIVSGLPRSGTSMMMRMLDVGGIPALIDNVRTADVDNPMGYYEFEPVKQTKKDPSWLKDSPGKTVKMVHLLLLDLPMSYQYRVVFMRRALEEVVKSQDVMLERKGKGGGDMSKEKLMEIFKGQMEKVEKWVTTNPNFKLLNVSYNDMLKDPAPAVKAINDFLGGDLNTEAMKAVVDPTLYRQRKS